MRSNEQTTLKTFNPKEIKTFSFADYFYDEQSHTLTLNYKLDDTNFEERFYFPGAGKISLEQNVGFSKACRLLHIICGASYYKAALPPNIAFTSYTISESEAKFYKKLYQNGLAEYAYCNNVSLQHIVFPYSESTIENTSTTTLAEGIVIPIGGGKDSLVTVELIKKTGQEFSNFIIGDFPVIESVAEKTGGATINVKRSLSPQLFEINKLGALNGHIPISAVIAGALLVSSFLYGFNTAILSNERSADFGNLEVGGVSINHQYSKSYEFEVDFQNLVRNTLGINFNYFSLLRPLSELRIAELFAQTKTYDSHFTSCNMAFKLLEANRSKSLWCGRCPKCLSTFLCLAPFTERARLLEIFSANLLDDINNIDTYKELTGLKGHKPFECVLDYDEAKASLNYLSENVDWCNDAVIKWYKQNRGDKPIELDEFLRPSGKHSIPASFQNLYPIEG